MKTTSMFLLTLVVCSSAALCDSASAKGDTWKQWGGPRRDFTVEDVTLADRWPKDGPKELWRRPLGDGCAAVVVEGDMLFTLYRTQKKEFAVALNAKTGKTIWEFGWDEPFRPGEGDHSHGAYSTPLVAGDRLFAIGVGGKMHCFDKQTGKVLWKHNLTTEFGGKQRMFGHAVSPLAYENLVIVPADRPVPSGRSDARAQALVAYDQSTGDIVWQSDDFLVDIIDHSSPLLIEFAGRMQVVLRVWTDLIGFDMKSGKILWRHGGMDRGEVYPTPLWIDGQYLFCARLNGSHLIRLRQRGDIIKTELVWESSQIRVHYVNAVLHDGRIICFNDPGVLLCVDYLTGEIVTRRRFSSQGNCVSVGDKLVVLGHDGELSLVKMKSGNLSVRAKAKILNRQAWAVPTIVGNNLYVRDLESIVALDLG